MRQPGPVQPAKESSVEMDMGWNRRGWYGETGVSQRDHTPSDQDDHHDRRDAHDPQRFGAGLVDALNVFPPEINGHEDGKTRGKRIVRNVDGMMQASCQIGYEP